MVVKNSKARKSLSLLVMSLAVQTKNKKLPINPIVIILRLENTARFISEPNKVSKIDLTSSWKKMTGSNVITKPHEIFILRLARPKYERSL